MTKIDELLGDARDIVILGHVHPDGDCVGSCLGLWNYLKDKNGNRVLLSSSPMKLRMLIYILKNILLHLKSTILWQEYQIDSLN